MPGSSTYSNVGGWPVVALGLLFQVAAAAGCGPTLPPPGSPGAPDREAQLERQLAVQRRKLVELQSRLELLESEAREQRVSTLARDSVRLTQDLSAPDAAPDEDAVVVPWSPELMERLLAIDSRAAKADTQAEAGANEQARPQLRLHGRRPVATGRGAALAARTRVATPAATSEVERGSKAASPPASARAGLPQVQERLAVVPLPPRERRRAKPGPHLQRRYRYALQLLQRQHYPAARRELSLLIRRNPNDDRYYYWRGEAAYAARDYRAALRDFRRVIDQQPASRKMAASLLKAGLCHHHLGEAVESAAVLERMQREFPQSATAPLAAMEVR